MEAQDVAAAQQHPAEAAQQQQQQEQQQQQRSKKQAKKRRGAETNEYVPITEGLSEHVRRIRVRARVANEQSCK